MVGVVVAVVMSALLLVIGKRRVQRAHPRARRCWRSSWPSIVGAAAFACIAFRGLHAHPLDAEAAAPAINLTVLPLYFISGVFVPESQIPSVLRDIADRSSRSATSPQALRQPFLESGKPMKLGDLAVVAAWGLACLLIAARTFRWTPSSEG